MSRQEGAIFFYPGFPSLVTQYFDTNDFYFSGHVANCTLLTIENMGLKNKKLAWYSFFVLLHNWPFLILVRTHYFIDLISGMICAYFFHKLCEKVSFYVDVKMIGWTAKKRC
mmetsp:Transcript_10348/g.14257  ORF Transcript_10348/g.14257 Transcript_10348/m.14257 type:complete len:112 (+) Transcript_10348:598-933(+)